MPPDHSRRIQVPLGFPGIAEVLKWLRLPRTISSYALNICRGDQRTHFSDAGPCILENAIQASASLGIDGGENDVHEIRVCQLPYRSDRRLQVNKFAEVLSCRILVSPDRFLTWNALIRVIAPNKVVWRRYS